MKIQHWIFAIATGILLNVLFEKVLDNHIKQQLQSQDSTLIQRQIDDAYNNGVAWGKASCH